MDTRRLLTTMLIVGALFLGFQMFFNRPQPAPGTPGAPGTYPYYVTIPQGMPSYAEGDARPQQIVLGDASKKESEGGTKVAMIVNTQTAGVDLVQLNMHAYAETVKRDKPLTLLQSEPSLAKPFATLGVHLVLNDVELPFGFVREKSDRGERSETARRVKWDDSAATVHQANSTFLLDTQYVWKVTHQTATELDLSMSFASGDQRIAEVTKSFRIDPGSYDVKIWHTVKNLAEGALKVQIDQLGPGELPRDDPQADDRFYSGVKLNSAKKYVDSGHPFNATHGELSGWAGGTKTIGQMADFAADPVLWVASSNRFFTAIVRPEPMVDNPATVTLSSNSRVIPEVTHVQAAHLDVMKWSAKAPEARGILRLVGSMIGVGRGETVRQPLTVYMGPKQREILEGNPTAAAGTETYLRAAYEYKTVIQLAVGCYANCTWEFLANWILALLNFFYRTVAFGNYGVAIMILVIVVRAALHPLTRSSQINMAVMGKKMKDVQPLIEAVKKRYPNDKKKQTEETMRIYKEKNVNPAGGLLGCLPMLIQMPIWAALWSGLRTDIDLRHQPFIPGWINDLSHPDTVFPTTLPVMGQPLFTIPLLGEIYGLNLLPILLGVVFFFQMKVSMASQPKPADEQQAQMQKMSMYMIYLFPLFLYSAPSGLNLYIFASTIGGLVDTWLVRKTLKKRGILPATAQTLPTHKENAEA